MGFFSSLFGFGGRRVEVRYVSAATHVMGLSVADLYDSQPALRAVVSFIAGNVASIPIKCYLRKSDTDRERDTDGVLPTLLANPNDHTTTHELMLKTVSDFKLYGFAAWVVIPSLDGPSGWTIEEIPSSWISDITSKDGITATSYRVRNPVTGKESDVDANDVILFSEYSPEGLGNASPVNALKQVLAEQVSAWEYRNQVWKNGGRVSQAIERPLGAEWAPEDRERFAKSWKNRFAGNGGTDSGGTPILEDGMKLVQTQFNAREAQWQEATKLAREDVAAVYHVNPSLVWHTDAQTYASSKDNARALYAETLQPILDFFAERINAFLLPKIGAPANEYAEFDISKKLEASFEEQASVLQSSTGGPWMTRNEARARMNMPEIDGGDELIVPMNVTTGGLAAPNDTDPTKGWPDAQGRKMGVLSMPRPRERHGFKKSSGARGDADDLEAVIRAFYDDHMEDIAGYIAETEDVFGMKDTLVSILSDELSGPVGRTSLEAARRTAALMGADPDSLNLDKVSELANDLCEMRADDIMQSALSKIYDNIVRSELESPEDVRQFVIDSLTSSQGYSGTNARTLASCAEQQAVVHAAKQVDPKCQKEWHCHSAHPRATHAALAGKRIKIDEKFNVGGHMARWPCDTGLPAEESANCSCTVDIISKGKNPFRDERVREVVNSLKLVDFNPEAVDYAIVDCQDTLGCGGRSWQGLSVDEKRGVLEELWSRDREWVSHGVTPEVGYESEAVKKLEETRYPHEIVTCERLSSHGVPCTLVNDNVPELDEFGVPTGRSLNYADLENGMEIKVLNGGSTYNTINGHLKNTSKKLNAKSVVFDNTDNKALSLSSLTEYANKSQAFRRGKVYVLTNDGRYLRIR